MASLHLATLPNGSQVRISTRSGEYVGFTAVLKDIINDNRFSLEISTLYNGATYHSLLSFTYREIGHFNVFCSGALPGCLSFYSNDASSHLITYMPAVNGMLPTPVRLANTEVMTRDIRALGFDLPMFHNLINDENEMLRALDMLEDSEVIGVAAEGNYFHRRGPIYWIQIATKRHVFIFDVLILRGKLFDRGLRDIFQSNRIQKVIHDCRFLSDVLCDSYNCYLVNVFDTQVADALLCRSFSGNGRYSRKLNTYPYCVRHHLMVPPHLIYFPDKDPIGMERFSLRWLQRPLSFSLRYAAIKDVLYLLRLKRAYCEMLGEPIDAGVFVFLSTLRNREDFERNRLDDQPGMMPYRVCEEFDMHRRWRPEIPHESGIIREDRTQTPRSPRYGNMDYAGKPPSSSDSDKENQEHFECNHRRRRVPGVLELENSPTSRDALTLIQWIDDPRNVVDNSPATFRNAHVPEPRRRTNPGPYRNSSPMPRNEPRMESRGRMLPSCPPEPLRHMSPGPLRHSPVRHRDVLGNGTRGRTSPDMRFNNAPNSKDQFRLESLRRMLAELSQASSDDGLEPRRRMRPSSPPMYRDALGMGSSGYASPDAQESNEGYRWDSHDRRNPIVHRARLQIAGEAYGAVLPEFPDRFSSPRASVAVAEPGPYQPSDAEQNSASNNERTEEPNTSRLGFLRRKISSIFKK